MTARDPRQRRENAPGGRPHRHVVRVTADEELTLQKLANERSVTVSRLLYEAATGTLPTMKNKVATSELFGIRAELTKQGTNINQIARLANAQSYVFDTDLQQVREVIRELDERITRWLSDNNS